MGPKRIFFWDETCPITWHVLLYRLTQDRRRLWWAWWLAARWKMLYTWHVLIGLTWHVFRVNTLKLPTRGQLASGVEQLSVTLNAEWLWAIYIEPSLHMYRGYETSYGIIDATVVLSSSTAISKGINSTFSKLFPFHTFNWALAQLLSCFLALYNLCVSNFVLALF